MSFAHNAVHEITQAPKLAHLVLDATTIFNLNVQISEDLMVRPSASRRTPIRLSRVLEVIAPRIDNVVPAMIVYETAQMLEDGRSLVEIAGDSPKYNRRKRILTEPIQRSLRQFSHDGTVRIISPLPEDETPPAQFMRGMWQIASHVCSDPRIKRDAFYKALKWKRGINGGKDFGDDAAIEVMRDLKKSGRPIIFLSDDGGALDRAAEMGARKLTMINFLGALSGHGLLSAVGIKDDAVNAILDSMNDMMIAAGGDGSTFLNDRRHTNLRNQSFFSNQLVGLREECLEKQDIRSRMYSYPGGSPSYAVAGFRGGFD